MRVSIDESTGNEVVDIALDTLKMGKQALVFLGTKASCEKSAEDLANMLKGSSELDKLSLTAFHALSRPTKQCERLARCIKHGVAFHHSGLVHAQRELIEDAFRAGKIKVICSTPTLAMGVDLPSFRTIIRDLKRYGYNGMAWIPVLEYLQMAGRSGRPSFDTKGEAIIIAATSKEKHEITERYIKGLPEDIYSKLAVEPVLRTYLLSLIASGFINSRKEMVDFFSKTFFAHQYGDIESLRALLDKILGMLDEWEFVKVREEDFVPANDVGKDSLSATVLGKRVAELYIDPLTAHTFILKLRLATGKPVSVMSFLQMISHTLELRPLLKARTKDYETLNEAVVQHGDYFLDDLPAVYDEDYQEFADSVKTALFFLDWVDEKDEEFLMEKFAVRPGEVRVKLDLADWLLFSCEELSRILQFRELLRELMKLRMRIKDGIREELFPLIKLKGIGRVRARRMYSAGITDIGQVKSAQFQVLAKILGEAIAKDIKEQVGQEIKEASEHKKEPQGQTSLSDF